MPTPAQRLIYAVRTRNYDRLRELLQASNAHASRSTASRTALHAAAEEGDVIAAQIILAAGADINARMEYGRTPLHLSAGYGGPWELMDSDLDRQAACGRNRHRPWTEAIAREIAQLAKEKNVRIPRDLGLHDPIPEEARFDLFSGLLDCLGSPAELLNELTVRGVDVDRIDPDFAEFARGNPRYLRLTKLLLDSGAEVNAHDEVGQTPLYAAVELGTPEMAELLLRQGATIDGSTEPSAGSGLVEITLEYNKILIADVLLRHGAKLPAPTYLHVAATNGRREVVLWLLGHGVDLNCLNEDGDTALMVAARSGHHEIVTTLLERGANCRIQNHCREGLLLAAAGWPRCLEAILPLNFPLDAQNTDGATALHFAAQSADWTAVQKLLRAGASPNQQDSAGNTPLHMILISDEPRPDVEFPIFHSLVKGGCRPFD